MLLIHKCILMGYLIIIWCHANVSEKQRIKPPALRRMQEVGVLPPPPARPAERASQRIVLSDPLQVFCITASVRGYITYISVEHPHVEYWNPKYLNYANMTNKRYGRKNPVYYVGLNFENIVPLDESLNVDFYFFEWLSNQYKRSFVEMHFTWCSLVEKDPFFGAAMRQGKLAKPCPHPPDKYHLYNMTINPAIIPRGFPFTRGRIYANITHPKTKTRVADGHINMKIEYINKEKAKNLFKERK